jgi:hypothetical protein
MEHLEKVMMVVFPDKVRNGRDGSAEEEDWDEWTCFR